LSLKKNRVTEEEEDRREGEEYRVRGDEGSAFLSLIGYKQL